MRSGRWIGFAAAGVSLLAMLACSGGGHQLDAEKAARGQLIFERYCTSCHGTSATGDGELAATLDKRPPDLTALSKRYGGEYPWDAVTNSVAKGTPGHTSPDMPAWTEVFGKTEGTEASSPAEAVELVTQYIWSIQKH